MGSLKLFLEGILYDLNICFGSVRASSGLETPLIVSEDQTVLYAK